MLKRLPTPQTKKLSNVVRLHPETVEKLDIFLADLNEQLFKHGYYQISRSILLKYITDESIKNFNLEHFIKVNTEEENSHE
ncbi:hypothetical protein R4575_18020 [Acinetobacter baumannii]|nr:hypothetical protein [Acinetobacter baumannii]